MNDINAHNAEMVKHIADVEGHTALLKGQLQQTETHWNRAVADNARLHHHMAVLSAKLQVTCQLSAIILSLLSAHWLYTEPCSVSSMQHSVHALVHY